MDGPASTASSGGIVKPKKIVVSIADSPSPPYVSDGVQKQTRLAALRRAGTSLTQGRQEREEALRRSETRLDHYEDIVGNESAAVIDDELLNRRMWHVEGLPDGHTALSAEERCQIAAVFVRHALAREAPEKVNWASARSRSVYLLVNRSAWSTALHVALMTLCCLAFAEPTTTWGEPAAAAAWTSVLELCAVTIIAADLCARIVYMSPRVFFSSNRLSRAAYAVLVLLLAADAVHAAVASGARGVCAFRFARPLRVLCLPFINPACSHTLLAVSRVVPALSDVLGLITVFILITSLLTTIAFGSAGGALSDAAPPGTLANGSAAADVVVDDYDPFASLGMSVVSLLTMLFTGDNFPHTMWSAFRCDALTCGVGWGSSFFVLFILVGNITIMSTFVAMTFEVAVPSSADETPLSAVDCR